MASGSSRCTSCIVFVLLLALVTQTGSVGDYDKINTADEGEQKAVTSTSADTEPTSPAACGTQDNNPDPASTPGDGFD